MCAIGSMETILSPASSSNTSKANLVFDHRLQMCIRDKEYALRDTNFPTVDPADPYRLTEEERELVEKIHYSFKMCIRDSFCSIER